MKQLILLLSGVVAVFIGLILAVLILEGPWIFLPYVLLFGGMACIASGAETFKK